jgi:hypothetical protein
MANSAAPAGCKTKIIKGFRAMGAESGIERGTPLACHAGHPAGTAHAGMRRGQGR